LLALRDERLASARAGVKARTHLLRCLQLDPQMADAYTGLGLYDYYADTLSPMARLLRFLMRIPGGSKQEGIRQLQIAIDKGDVLRVEARFYLAKNLRTFDLDYARSLEVFSPLTDEFPRNPIFQLIQGDILAKLGRGEQAAASFRQTEQLSSGQTLCDRQVRALAGRSATAFAGISTDH
jgi:tetratricopeptide (TPR) repeat protein